MRVEARTRAVREALGRICPPERLALADLEIFAGPNPWCDGPVVLGRVEIGPATPTGAELEAAIGRCAEALGLAAATGGRGTRQAAGERIGALLAGISGGLMSRGFGIELRSGSAIDTGGGITFWAEYLIVAGAFAAARLALLAAGAALSGDGDPAGPLASELRRWKGLCARVRPNNESRILIEAARRRDIPVLPLCDYPSLWQFGWGARSELFWVTASNSDGVVGGRLSRFKDYQKRLFRSLGLPTPAWRVLASDTDLERLARAIGFPCVAKPIDGSGGKGVNADIRDMATLRQAVATGRRFSKQLLIEAHQPGDDHRLMVVDGKLVMAVRRDPPSVTGDGRSSITMLLAALNARRVKERERGGFLKPVPVDQGLRIALRGQGLTPDSVPAKGDRVRLRSNANHATGGDCANVLDQVHPQVARQAEHMAEAFGFRVAGIDYITPDIAEDPDEVGGGFIEINTAAGMEVLITEGIVRQDLAELVLGLKPGRIEVHLIVAPAGDQDAIVASAAAGLGAGEAIATGAVSRLGTMKLPNGNASPSDRVNALLRYPTLKKLTIVWTGEQLRLSGLPVDRVDRSDLLGEELPPEWVALLERRSEELSTCDTLAALRKRLEAKRAER